VGTQQKSELKKKDREYQPGGINLLQKIFERHFSDFVRVYEDDYADRYGKYRLERIKTIGEHFLACGDYLNGVARIRCTNPDCCHDYFRPFSCKGFYLCPSCSQKRTILMAEHLTEEVLLRLPHRQFVFKTGTVIAHQTFGDMLRWNPHFHCLVLEGGFDEEGNFVYIPFSSLQKMTEYFRRRVIGLFLKNNMINEGFARNLLSWKNSGFSIDNSVQKKTFICLKDVIFSL